MFGLLGLKWLNALVASTLNCSRWLSRTLNSFCNARLNNSRPGPYVRTGGMLPMMPFVNGAYPLGSWKLLGSIGYHKCGSDVEPTSDGLAPDGNHRASSVAFSIWQRN